MDLIFSIFIFQGQNQYIFFVTRFYIYPESFISKYFILNDFLTKNPCQMTAIIKWICPFVNRFTSHSFRFIYFKICDRGKDCTGTTESIKTKLRVKVSLLSTTEIPKINSQDILTRCGISNLSLAPRAPKSSNRISMKNSKQNLIASKQRLTLNYSLKPKDLCTKKQD